MCVKSSRCSPRGGTTTTTTTTTTTYNDDVREQGLPHAAAAVDVQLHPSAMVSTPKDTPRVINDCDSAAATYVEPAIEVLGEAASSTSGITSPTISDVLTGNEVPTVRGAPDAPVTDHVYHVEDAVESPQACRGRCFTAQVAPSAGARAGRGVRGRPHGHGALGLGLAREGRGVAPGAADELKSVH